MIRNYLHIHTLCNEYNEIDNLTGILGGGENKYCEIDITHTHIYKVCKRKFL